MGCAASTSPLNGGRAEKYSPEDEPKQRTFQRVLLDDIVNEESYQSLDIGKTTHSSASSCLSRPSPISPALLLRGGFAHPAAVAAAAVVAMRGSEDLRAERSKQFTQQEENTEEDGDTPPPLLPEDPIKRGSPSSQGLSPADSTTGTRELQGDVAFERGSELQWVQQQWQERHRQELGQAERREREWRAQQQKLEQEAINLPIDDAIPKLQQLAQKARDHARELEGEAKRTSSRLLCLHEREERIKLALDDVAHRLDIPSPSLPPLPKEYSSTQEEAIADHHATIRADVQMLMTVCRDLEGRLDSVLQGNVESPEQLLIKEFKRQMERRRGEALSFVRRITATEGFLIFMAAREAAIVQIFSDMVTTCLDKGVKPPPLRDYRLTPEESLDELFGKGEAETGRLRSRCEELEEQIVGALAANTRYGAMLMDEKKRAQSLEAKTKALEAEIARLNMELRRQSTPNTSPGMRRLGSVPLSPSRRALSRPSSPRPPRRPPREDLEELQADICELLDNGSTESPKKVVSEAGTSECCDDPLQDVPAGLARRRSSVRLRSARGKRMQRKGSWSLDHRIASVTKSALEPTGTDRWRVAVQAVIGANRLQRIGQGGTTHTWDDYLAVTMPSGSQRDLRQGRWLGNSLRRITLNALEDDEFDIYSAQPGTSAPDPLAATS